MNIQCEQCRAKYTVTDERFAREALRRTVKVKCRRCGATIVLAPPDDGPPTERPTVAKPDVVVLSSPPDDVLRSELLTHLDGLRRQGVISQLHSQQPTPGADRDAEVQRLLARADVVLVLLSAHALADGIWAVAERYSYGRVLPIRVRPCVLQGTPIERLNLLPSNGLPVASWIHRDEAWTEIVSAVRALAQDPTTFVVSAPDELYEADEREHILGLIEAAQARLRTLEQAGGDTDEVKREILQLKRQAREGGHLRAGDSLGDGRYFLLRRIGRGGFANVWEAEDRTRRTRVAVKVLHSEFATDPIRRDRFYRGARIMMEMNDDGIVRILDPSGRDGGFHYFVMEYLPGGDLRQAVLAKRIGPLNFLPIILQVGETLARAHRAGFVHRDVKPANILLHADGSPRLTDFDLVGGAETTGGTRTGALGTFLYAAPEVMMDAQDSDQRADVYGLAMTAAFCIHAAELPVTLLEDKKGFFSGLPCDTSIRDALVKGAASEVAKRTGSIATLCGELAASAEWFLRLDETELGPMSAEAVRQQTSSTSLTVGVFVRHRDSDKWLPIEALSGTF